MSGSKAVRILRVIDRLVYAVRDHQASRSVRAELYRKIPKLSRDCYHRIGTSQRPLQGKPSVTILREHRLTSAKCDSERAADDCCQVRSNDAFGISEM